jgi:hypothetical protein
MGFSRDDGRQDKRFANTPILDVQLLPFSGYTLVASLCKDIN